MAAPINLRKLRVGHVGSFLRPPRLVEARKHVEDGVLSAAELRAIEDSVITRMVASQKESGLQCVTDGEQRRAFFHVDFLSQLEGISTVYGDISSDDVENYVPPSLAITGKIWHKRPIQLDDFLFLQRQADAQGLIAKVCIPSPSMVYHLSGKDNISDKAYTDMDDLFSDVALAYRAEIKSLYDAGCRYIQIDEPYVSFFCDPDVRADTERKGDNWETLLQRYTALVNDCIKDKPNDLVIGMHMCKGNFRSRSFAKGDYEPIAKAIFSEFNVDVLYLEWEDDTRSGDFAPLRFLPSDPEDKRVVMLGLVSSKFGALEKKEDVIRKIYEAARYAPRGLDQLGLSTQCGFASTIHGNFVSAEDQWAKLKLMREIADEVWGSL